MRKRWHVANLRLLRVFAASVVITLMSMLMASGDRLHLGVNTNATIELADGTVFKLLRITHEDANSVTFRHATGISTIRFTEMIPASRALFGITNAISRPTLALLNTNRAFAHVCPTCHGSRSIVCPDCHGAKFSGDKDVSKVCEKCNGTGHVSVMHSYSYGGGPGARVKGGSYTTTESCSECKGSGRIVSTARGYCTRCGGTGVVACPICAH